MPQSSNRQGFLCADWLTPMSCCLLEYSLATSAYGTALGVIRALHSSGKLETAFCTETRPYNQVHPVALISTFSQSCPSSRGSFYEPFAELCQKSSVQCILFDRISSGLCIWWFKRHKVPSVDNKQKPCIASGFWFALMHLWFTSSSQYQWLVIWGGVQGSRLTAFELVHEKIPAVLVADSAAAALMSLGRVDSVVVGADRIAANGLSNHGNHLSAHLLHLAVSVLLLAFCSTLAL
jgi:hypothetical protein